MTHSLYWHLATIAPDWHGNGFPPPHQHQLISLAGIEVQHDPTGTPEVLDVWGMLASDPRKLLARFDAAVGEAEEVVGVFSDVFGIPVLLANVLATGYTGNTLASAVHDKWRSFDDVAAQLSELVSPGNRMTFDDITDLLGLPVRKKVDVAVALHNVDPKAKQIIPKALLMDCCLVCCVAMRLQKMLGTLEPDYCDAVENAVIAAASERVPPIGQAFAALREDDDAE